MAFEVSYNGVKIDLTKVHEIAYTPQFDEARQYLMTRVRVAVTGVINPKATSYAMVGGVPVQVDGSSATVTHQAIRHALAQPRGVLTVDIGGDSPPLVFAPTLPDDTSGVAGHVDLDNGPIPGPLTINRVDGTKSFMVAWSCEAAIRECPDPGEGQAILSNRYAVSHQVDDTSFTTQVSRGQTLFRTDILDAAGKQADEYRDQIFPPVPRGFRRVAVDITATPNNNALTWTVVDRERPFDLGDTDARKGRSGIVDLEGRRELTSTGTKDGAAVSYMVMARVQLTARGNKFSSNWAMTQGLFKVLQTVLPFGQPRAYVRQIGVSQSLTSREVSLHCEMMLAPELAGTIGIIQADILRVDNVFADKGGVNPGLPNRAGTAGSHAETILTAAWRSACQKSASPTPTLGPSRPGSPDAPTGDEPPAVTVTATDVLPEVPTGYTPGTTDYPYTDYRVTVDHEYRTFGMQVPVTGTPGAPGSGTTLSTTSPYWEDKGSGGGGGAPSFGFDEGPAGSVGGFGSGPPSCEVLFLAAPMGRRIVRWSAERVNQMPDLPASAPTDPNLILIDDAQVQSEAPVLLPDGTSYAYRVSGRYVYAMRRPTASGGLPMGLMPWMQGDTSNTLLPPESFVDGIIDPPANHSGP